LTAGGETVDVEVGEMGEENNALFLVADRRFEIRHDAISTNCYRLEKEGRAYEVFVARGFRGEKQVFINGRTFLVQNADMQPRARAGRGGSGQTPGEVTPPMPAVVVRVLVRERDSVKRGQGLVVVSAMKMETTLYAPYAGVVRAVNCDVDKRVAPGDILVEIDEEEHE